jgi:hypothetical protein
VAIAEPDSHGVLACGRDLDTLYEHVKAGQSDGHEQGCPHCTQAASFLAPAARAACALAAERPEPPAGFAAAVMARIRADPRRSRKLRLPAGGPSSLQITEHAAAGVLAAAVGGVPGVTVRGCRFPDSGDPAHVAVAVSVTYGTGAGVFDELRQRLREAGRAYLGVTMTDIDIDVDDVQ